MIVVPRTPTPISEGALSTLLVGKLRDRLGRQPTQEMASLLLALIRVETGGTPMNHNMGNITAGESYPQIWRPPWYDIDEVNQIADPQKREKMLRLHAGMVANPPTVPKAFRAYDSADAGMGDYIDQLFRVFPEVVSAAETGDPRKFVDALAVKYSKDYGPNHAATFQQIQKGIGERQVFAALPKAGARGAGGSSSSPSSRPASWPSVLEKVRDVPTIRIHSSSFYVVVWRYLLNVAMGTNLELTTGFDGATDEVTRAFQKQRKLVADGVVGVRTWGAMLEAQT